MYCICQQVHWIYHQVYCRGHHVHQEPHLGVLHLPIKCTVETAMYSISGAPLGCTAYPIMYIRSPTWCTVFANRSTAYAVMYMYIRSLALPSCVLQIPSCTSGATLGCTTLAIKCTVEANLYFRSPTWVYCICHQVYCISYHHGHSYHWGRRGDYIICFCPDHGWV